jgi:formylglycine-generating enzyme required for sulfatase activity
LLVLDEIRIHDPYYSGVVLNNLTLTPSSPTATNPVTASLDIQPFSDAADIQATLYYRLGGETAYSSIPLTNTSGITYTTVTPIPGNLVPDYWGYRVEYYIRCTFTGDQCAITGPVDFPASGSNTPAFYGIESDIARVTLNNLTQTYNGSNRIVTASTVPTGLTVDITYDGNLASPIHAGSYLIVATINDPAFQGTQTGTLVVAKADQTIAFPALEAQSTNATVILQASASSGLPVAFGVVSGPGIITDETQLTFNATGSVTIVATQDGNLNWNPAPAVTRNVDALEGNPYLVIDLSGGSNAVSYPLNYLAAVPAGGWTDDYKTTKLVLRLIPGGTFLMGSPANELGRYNNETQHLVTVTQPFYIGVFEVTQKQWERVMGTWPSYFTNASYRDSRPVEQVSYYQIRENPNNTDDSTVNWPTNNLVNTNSFMGKLRSRTGRVFDLPTESQWEYAGRAGTATALNSGYNITNVYSDAHLAEVGRYWYNGGSRYTQTGNTSVATAKVGSNLPNAWGLYDIHGNGWEWCLDWYGAYPTAVENVNPAGATSGTGRAYRGGGWDGDAYLCRVAYRNYGDPHDVYRNIGFRVALILDNLSQSITFAPLGPQRVETLLALSATASSGLPVSFTNLPGSPVQWLNATQIVFTGTGRVMIVASQLGNASWAAAAPVTNSFEVIDEKILVPVLLNNLTQTYNGSNRIVTASTLPTGLDVEVTYNGGITPPINAGSYAITGTVNDLIYQGIQTGTLVVIKGDQTIIFPNPDTQFTNSTVILQATASSGLPVSFGVAGGPGMISDGTQLTFSATGWVSIVASQEGDDNWNPAPQWTNTFNVTNTVALVILNDLIQTYNGSNRIVTASTLPPGLDVEVTYNGDITPPINAGSYAIIGWVNDSIYQGMQTGTLVVAKANQMITVMNPGDQIQNSTVVLSASASSGLPVTLALGSGPGTLTEGVQLVLNGTGVVTIVATQAGDDNWNPAQPVSTQFRVLLAQDRAFFRILSSTTSVITAFSPNGVMAWSNGAIGATGCIQRATTLMGPSNWADFIAFAATGTLMILPTADYLVVDLAGGPSASNYPVSYLAAIPSGGWTDEYKTTKMVFRLIPASTYMMGSPGNEPGRNFDETQHQVTLTQPFYMGVFEVTQKQWERVMGTWPSYFTNASYCDSRPVEQVSYHDIRGASAGAGWPANNNVDADSFMGRLRARTGKVFDLPTESQWEYAGRAGTTEALNSGKNLTDLSECPNLAEVGRYWSNGGAGYTPNGNTSVGTAKVGSYLSNAWGLYDIHGNVWEWCLDWYGEYPGTVSDPKGGTTGSARLDRGGSWGTSAVDCRIAYHSDYRLPYLAYTIAGFRAVLPMGQ